MCTWQMEIEFFFPENNLKLVLRININIARMQAMPYECIIRHSLKSHRMYAIKNLFHGQIVIYIILHL